MRTNANASSAKTSTRNNAIKVVLDEERFRAPYGYSDMMARLSTTSKSVKTNVNIRGNSQMIIKFRQLRHHMNNVVKAANIVADMYKKFMKKKNKEETVYKFLVEVHDRSYITHRYLNELLRYFDETDSISNPQGFKYMKAVLQAHFDDNKWNNVFWMSSEDFGMVIYDGTHNLRLNSNDIKTTNNYTIMKNNSNTNDYNTNAYNTNNDYNNGDDLDDFYTPLIMNFLTLYLMSRLQQVFKEEPTTRNVDLPANTKLDDKYGKLRLLIHNLIKEATAVEDIYITLSKTNKNATKTVLREVHNRTYKMHNTNAEVINYVFRNGIESYPNSFQHIWKVVEANLDDRFKWRPYMSSPNSNRNTNTNSNINSYTNSNSNNNSNRNSNSNNNSNINNNRNVENKDDLYAPLLLHLGVIDLMNRVLQVLDKISKVPRQMNNGTPHR
jgi:hypothetical protein